MDLYASTSYQLAEQLTKRYSTSFSMSSRLFDSSIRRHIYAIYGLVRIADEIVDTYEGDDKLAQIDDLHNETKRAMTVGYSVNPIVHAFALTAREYGIDHDLLEPFIDSMKMDLTLKTFNQEQYTRYIYGSAEVVGLMCLRVFVKKDDASYNSLADGARSLGAGYQKVNFLRDMKADYDTLGRVYFPGISFETFTDEDRDAIIADIEKDFSVADTAIRRLPANARSAVRASYYYYDGLLQKLTILPADTIIAKRVRVANWRKLLLLVRAWMDI